MSTREISTTPVTSTTTGRLRVVVTTVVAACVTWWAIVALAGVDLHAPAFDGDTPGQDIGLLAVFFVSLLASLAGWLALGLIERYTRRPRTWWLTVSGGALLLSLSGPLTGAGIDGLQRTLLVVLHLVVGVVLIPLFYKSITQNEATE